ncbi:MAG: hypothetical protein HGA76_11335 [Candidatus Firestonebacteria bacterium]|nr:hypothetical protein [Candidatus Firestonebacteria bacterium]
MKKLLGILVLLLCASTVWAAPVKLYPGAVQDGSETGHFQAVKAKSSPALRAKMGQETFYVTPDKFEKVYAFYKKLYPETNLSLRKLNVPMHGGGVFSEAYFCLDGIRNLRRSKHWLKIQSPFISAAGSNGPHYRANAENLTVIVVVSK